MARINIEDELWSDARFMLLVSEVGEERAIGQLIRFWRIAQNFYKQDRKPIPHHIFKAMKLSQRIVSVGLADVSDEGIFAVDSERHFGWLVSRVKGGESRKANKNKDLLNAQPTKSMHGNQNLDMPLTLTLTQSLTKNTVTSTSVDANVLVEIWNTHCNTLPKVKELTQQRKLKAIARIKENPDTEYWKQIVTRLARSSFCNGENKNAWRANFDFLLRPDTHVKVSEGNYDNKGKKQSEGFL